MLLSDNSEISETFNFTELPELLGSSKISPLDSLIVEFPRKSEFESKYRLLNFLFKLPKSTVALPRGTKSPITVP